MAEGVRWAVLVCCCMLGMVIHTNAQYTYPSIRVDMTGNGCFDTSEKPLKDDMVYRLTADYRPNIQQTLDHCDVTIRAVEANRQIVYIMERLVVFDCGIEILIFDNPQLSTTPTRRITCNDDKTTVTGTTSHGVIKVSLRKQSAQSGAFDFQMAVKTNFGPDIEVDQKGSQFYEQPLDAGAIVGIAIAGAILIIALVGIAIYCCLKNRAQNEQMKYAEAGDGRSSAPTSVFTSGTSQVMYPGAGGSQRRNGSGGKYGSMEDVRSSTSAQDRAHNAYANKGYEADGDDEKRFNRSESYKREKGGHRNAAFDDTDTYIKGGHDSRRDSQRGAKYDKKKGYSRNEEYAMTKVSKQPNGILKSSRSRSPDRSQSSTEGSTVDTANTANAAVYGYSATQKNNPNVHHMPKDLERSHSRSRSRSRGRSRSGGPGSSGSGHSSHHSRKGSIGKSGKGAPPKSARQYNDLSNFLDSGSQRNRPRSRSSGSLGRSSRPRSDSRNSETTPSEVSSYTPSGSSSKKTTGTGRRVQIQGVEEEV